jgi:hypothetical protein
MLTNLKIWPRLLSFAAATLVLFTMVNADAQMPTTRSVAIPPIPPGQARIWIYASPVPTMPNNYPIMQAITLNGVKVGYQTLGAAFYRDVPPGHYVVAAPGFFSDSLDPSQKAPVDLVAGQQAYLKLESIAWPNGGGDGGDWVNVYYVRPMPPQTGYTAVAQLAFLGGN